MSALCRSTSVSNKLLDYRAGGVITEIIRVGGGGGVRDNIIIGMPQHVGRTSMSYFHVVYCCSCLKWWSVWPE